ncbi:aldehyde dehydrogenase family protein [Desulfitobacterium sp. PCE1]|uniref:aldehyde dehydrogenase family protein n=1 Tax=Desulfitobacterium sp. PCE1 TaxID=146907 RepID=UPI00039A83B3
MQEEVFGPLLPVLEFENFDVALSSVNQHPKPLTLYLFTRSKDHGAQAIRETSFGGGCINDTHHPPG